MHCIRLEPKKYSENIEVEYVSEESVITIMRHCIVGLRLLFLDGNGTFCAKRTVPNIGHGEHIGDPITKAREVQDCARAGPATGYLALSLM